ncbi:IS110 family transposase [Bifidobacterium pullorum]|uniref:IS110 family transposase n=1 Tax=Bifidobacterium pullorum TaxID=78448 RepID=UPI001EF40A8A|nr:transposase [Bifidobacterium pullorum]
MEHPRIYAGVDTHSDTHTLALIDEHGRPLATQTFTADPTGYERLAAMIGDPDACLGIGVEGTNSYGAAPARRLVKAGYDVHEVLRPKRSVRRKDGKSDPCF